MTIILKTVSDYTEIRDATIPIPPIPILFSTGSIGIGRVFVLLGIGIDISMTLRKFYFEKLLIFHKV